jgi:hypothetical protein
MDFVSGRAVQGLSDRPHGKEFQNKVKVATLKRRAHGNNDSQLGRDALTTTRQWACMQHEISSLCGSKVLSTLLCSRNPGKRENYNRKKPLA